MDGLAAQSWESIRRGSKSFAAAARLLDAPTRESASMLYAWCRYCDDVIDDQVLGHGRGGRESSTEARLADLRERTHRALLGRPIQDPPFQALQTVVERHSIAHEHPFDLIEGFAMDVSNLRYRTIDDTLRYCYHVAGVVGVMMASVMGVRPGETDTFNRAADLGIAFQLTNIARDVMDDAAIGRVYLPLEWLAEEGVTIEAIGERANREAVARVTARLLQCAEPYYRSALVGVARLPLRAAWGIATARAIYRRIGVIVAARKAAAWDRRVHVPSREKLIFAAVEGVRATWLVGSGARASAVPRTGLWTRFE